MSQVADLQLPAPLSTIPYQCSKSNVVFLLLLQAMSRPPRPPGGALPLLLQLLPPLLALAVSLFAGGAQGHGRLIEPPSRSSMWR